jgi:hypothetical protein
MLKKVLASTGVAAFLILGASAPSQAASPSNPGNDCAFKLGHLNRNVAKDSDSTPPEWYAENFWYVGVDNQKEFKDWICR